MKTGRASTTALHVQQGILHVARQPCYAGLVPEDMEHAGRRMLAGSDQGLKYLWQIETPWFRVLLQLMERLLLPGISLHYVLRKRFIEDCVRQSLDDGVRQIVSLGAGLDTLLWRLHSSYEDVCFIELDHPETLNLKRPAVVPANNLHLLEIDFTLQRIATFLQGQSCFNSAEPTLFISEGVLMYLEESDVIHFFREIKQLMTADANIIFTSMEPLGSPEYPDRFLLKAYLKLQKESFKWSVPRTGLQDFLHSLGYILKQTTHGGLLADRYLGISRPKRCNQIESVTVAQMS
jgi:methyltransferase (TIGR00027 family)